MTITNIINRLKKIEKDMDHFEEFDNTESDMTFRRASLDVQRSIIKLQELKESN